MILLASSSETRARILRAHGIEFVQKGCDFDEDSLTYTKPEHFVYYATLGKLHSCLSQFNLELPILVADTVVTADHVILRKAKDKQDAERILRHQSGNTVSIITCMMYQTKKAYFIDLSSTDYLFDTFDEEDLQNYLASDTWQGKAGACMVEGFCKKYIKEVRGLESTAMGLSIEKLIPFMDKC